MGAATPLAGAGMFSWNRRFGSIAPLWETSNMRAFGLKVLIVVVAALVGTAVIHSLVYLSIDPGSLSAQMPERYSFR